MKKSEIIQLALIILGILIIIRTIETLAVNTTILFRFQDMDQPVAGLIIGIVVMIVLMVVTGLFIIKKSEYFSKKIIKDEKDVEQKVSLSRVEILTISIIILSLYLLITGFPLFLGSLFSLLTSFFNDFKLFKETLPGQTWNIVEYILTLLIFLYAKSVSVWIERKVME